MYLDGLSLCQIKNELEKHGCHTTKGLVNWTPARIKSILTNERYCGDLLMQKTFIENCITKKHKKNMGELPKYYIKDDHPAIVSRETFNRVQVEIARRGTVRKKSTLSSMEKGKYSGKYALTNLLVCGECGSPYRRRIWMRKNGEKAVWRCVNRMENGVDSCDNISVDEFALQSAICRGIKRIFEGKEDVMKTIKNSCNYLLSGKDEYVFIASAEQQISEYRKLIDKSVELMIKTTGDKTRYEKDIAALNEKISVLQDKIKTEQNKISDNADIMAEIDNMEDIMNSFEELNECDEFMLKRIVNSIRVMKDNKIIIQLKGGYKIEEAL